jgi:hypothetical protein
LRVFMIGLCPQNLVLEEKEDKDKKSTSAGM